MKILNSFVLILITLYVPILPSHAQGNLVVNGSFENNGGSFTNWNLQTLSAGSNLGLILATAGYGLPGTFPNGNHIAVFTYDGGSISQTLSTIPGAFYALSFSAIQFDGTNEASVSINNSLLGLLNYKNYSFVSAFANYTIWNSYWEQLSFKFQATSNNTTIRFSESPQVYSSSDRTLYYSVGGLDNIVVTAVTQVPEPSCAVLLGGGMAVGLIYYRRRQLNPPKAP